MIDMTGLYIHIPFCKRKCPYCDFYSLDNQSEDILTAYVSRLSEEAKGYKDKKISVDTIYFGGGTPSVLRNSHICEILNEVRESFEVNSNAEITIEANPSSVDLKKLEGYREAGINRISFGVQSACDNELLSLGRLHSFKKAREAIKNAQAAGFENISADLMIAIEGQTSDSLKSSVSKIAGLGVNHISCYILKVEDGTPYSKMNLTLPDEDQCAEYYLLASKLICDSGYEQYEISNFAKKGFESRHNLKYWQGEEYIGLGVSAYSYFGGVRYHNKRDLFSYLRKADIKVIDETDINKSEEYLTLSLRLSDGISIKKYVALGGDFSILKKAKELPKSLIKIDRDKISLTNEGFLVSNEIIAKLLL